MWKIKERIFILISCLELSIGLLQMCQNEIPFRRFILWGFLGIYAAVLVTNHYTGKEKILLGASLVMGILLYLSTGINTGIKAPVYLFAMKEIPVRKLLKWMTISLMASMACIVAVSLLFDFGNLYISDYRKKGAFHGIRYSLGFASSNVLQFLTFILMCFCFYLYGEKMKFWQYLLVGAEYLLVFVLTYSRTGFLTGLFIWCLAVAIRFGKGKSWNRILFGLSVVFVTSFLIISLLAAMEVHGRVIEFINEIISRRMNQLKYHTSDKQYALPYIDSWRLFSSRINKNGYDMGYIQIFYYYGIIPGICYLGFLFYAGYRAMRRNNVFGLLALLGFGIYLFMESLFFSNYLTRDFLLMISAIIVWEAYHDTEGEKVPAAV